MSLVGVLALTTIGMTALAAWAIFQLSVERSCSRMVDGFREEDRKYERKLQDILFRGLDAQVKPPTPKANPPVSKKRKPSTRK